MTDVKVEEREETRKDHNGGMVDLAEEEVFFHTRPMPEAVPPPVVPFPAGVVRGLWAGIAVGALLGGLFGYLLLNHYVIIEGWEGLYSMTPLTFVVFWIFLGIAAGILLGGISAILLTEPVKRAELKERDQR